MGSQYALLPVEETRKATLPAPTPRRSRTFLTLFTSLLFLASLIRTATAWTPARSFAESPAVEDLESMIERATNGDQYLLGVGKADITG
jgi:hypothetical protein